MRNERVLVTGAGGFIGSHVCRQLVQRGARVHALVRPGSRLDRLEDIRGEVGLVQADLDDAPSTAAALDALKPDAAVHLAWYVEPGRYLHAVRENLRALEASVRLLHLLAQSGCSRVVVAGTSFERASSGRVEPYQTSAYVSAKEALHTAVSVLGAEDVAAACAHIFYVYGPGEDPRRLVPTVVQSLLKGEPVDVTDGTQRLDYLHVVDVAEALIVALEQRLDGSFDVGSGEPVPLSEVFRLIGHSAGQPDLINQGARVRGEGSVDWACADPSVLEAAGWRPTIGLSRGIEDTVVWWAHRIEQFLSAEVPR